MSLDDEMLDAMADYQDTDDLYQIWLMKNYHVINGDRLIELVDARVGFEEFLMEKSNG